MSNRSCEFCGNTEEDFDLKTCDYCGRVFCPECGPHRTDNIPIDCCDECAQPATGFPEDGGQCGGPSWTPEFFDDQGQGPEEFSEGGVDRMYESLERQGIDVEDYLDHDHSMDF